jgi:hypothetical protein
LEECDVKNATWIRNINHMIACALAITAGCAMPSGMTGGNENGNGNETSNDNDSGANDGSASNNNGNSGNVGNANANGNGKNNENNENGNGGNTPDELTPVLTGIRAHVQARIEVGDDLILFTGADNDGGATVAQYVIPTEGDTAPREVPTPNAFDNNSFLVAGKKMILLGDVATTDRDFGLTIYDTQTNSMIDIPLEDIRLASVPVSNFGPGFMVVDGNLIGTINDTGPLGVRGRELLRVVDISGDTPEVIRFTVNPNDDDLASIDQVVIDEENRILVAIQSIGTRLHVYDIDDPMAAPTLIDLSDTGLSTFDTQFAIEAGRLIYVGRPENKEFAFVIDVTKPDAAPTLLDTPRGGPSRPEMLGNLYTFRTNGGVITGEFPEINPVPPVEDSPGSTGSTVAIGLLNNNAPIFLIGGQDNISSGSGIRFSNGDGLFRNLFADPNDPEKPLTSGDVHTDPTGKYLGFKYEVDEDTFIGYSILNNNQ